jgi:hypothetical protein
MDQLDLMERRGQLDRLELLVQRGRLEEEGRPGLLGLLEQLETKVRLDVMGELDQMDILVGGVQVVQLVQQEEMVLLVGEGDMEILDFLEEQGRLVQLVFKVIYLKRHLQIQLLYLYHW